MLETCTLRFFHDFNTKGNRQRLAATTSSMFRIFSSTFFPWNSPNFKAHLYGACIPDGMIVSQLCAVDGFYCNFCWRLIRSSSVILNGFEGIVKERPTVDLHLFFAIEAAFTGAICAHCSDGWALHQRCTQSLDVMASAGTWTGRGAYFDRPQMMSFETSWY